MFSSNISHSVLNFYDRFKDQLIDKLLNGLSKTHNKKSQKVILKLFINSYK